jgi:hypothetical protein
MPALFLLGGCTCNGSVTPGQPCSKTEDCPVGQVCVNGECRPPDGGSGDGLTFVDGACGATVSCAKTCCRAGEVCRFDRCIEPQPPCTKDGDCINDSYCNNGECIPWGIGPRGDKNAACTYLVPIGLFAPAKQCSWTAPPAGDTYPNHKSVLGTPVVVDFNFDGDPKTLHPSIVFVSYDYTDGGGQASRCDDGYFGVIRVIDGNSCQQLHTVDMAKVRASTPLAVGDIDGDGRAEIVAVRCGGGLVAFRYDPTAGKFALLWTSSPADTGGTVGMWDGPSIHDLDDDGKPEILLSGTVWSSTGQLLDGALGFLPVSAGFIPVAADVDGDGVVELFNGVSLWKWQGGKWTLQSSSTTVDPGHVAVADFGTYGADATKDDRSKLDGVAEIAVVAPPTAAGGVGAVRVQTLAGRVIFGPVPLPSGGSGGPPTIGDFDDDGRAEVAAAGSDSYSVFDPDCTGTPQKATCDSVATTGLLWTKVSQDHSSNVTGSSIFDFEGDGKAEAVYADECFTRVYEGKTGEVLFSQYRSSCTWYENPIVADVDGDFKSELVVPSNLNCDIGTSCNSNPNYHKHPTSGLTLDPMFRGLRCKAGSDCLSASCDSGLCRCTSDTECGGAGFVCGPPVSGTPGSGQVCRSAFLGQIAGVLVYRDVLDRWVSSRMIWNQHAYAVTHVGEDGSIPKTSAWQRNWTVQGLNNFRQNKQGNLDPTSSPDVTAGKITGLTCDKQNNMTLKIKMCNRGTKPIAADTPVTFYKGDPAALQVICTAKNKFPIDPGQCEDVSCVWTNAPVNSPVDVTAVADDDGSGKGTTSECDEGNNKTVLKGISCATIY